MPIVVLLSSDFQADFTRGALRADERIDRALRERGVSLRPMHPGTAYSKLSRYYTIDVSDRDTADGLILLLSNLPGIEGAFWKPADEAP